MPGRKPRHRGPHPGDREIFAPGQLEALATAASELSWLLSRGYNARSALKLVGDRHALTARQRKAVGRCACGEPQLRQRLSRQVGAQELAGAQVQIDGFNVIIVLESALSGGLVLVGRDGCCRDMASIHGSYRRVDETLAAVDLVGRTLAELGAASARILLDRPVSNSGRLRAWLLEAAAGQGWDWEVERVNNPDRDLAASGGLVASGDGWVLDNSARWFDLTGHIIREHIPDAWLIKMSYRGV